MAQGVRGMRSRAVLAAVLAMMLSQSGGAAAGEGLWGVYEQALKGAKYVDLTHTITPKIPVWAGFSPSTFAPAKAGKDIEGYAVKGEVYTYAKHGFEATEYLLADRPTRDAARSAGALGARISGARRIAGDLRDPAAGRHLDRRATESLMPTTRSRSPTSRPGRRSTAASPKGRSCSFARTGRRPGRTRSSPP